MSRRIVIRLSGIAKAALTTAMVGVAMALYGREKGIDWVNATGGVLLLVGALTYLIERSRSWTRRRD